MVPKISKDNLPLIIRFRNKNDKGEEGDGFSSLSGGVQKSCAVNSMTSSSPQSPSHHLPILANGATPNKQPIALECYYWRTTGCDRDRCMYKHVPAHKGVDKQSWMRRKN